MIPCCVIKFKPSKTNTLYKGKNEIDDYKFQDSVILGWGGRQRAEIGEDHMH